MHQKRFQFVSACSATYCDGRFLIDNNLNHHISYSAAISKPE